MTLVRPRIKNHPGIRSKTFDFRDIVHTQSTAFVQAAGVCKHVPAACSIDVELDPLTTHRTLGVKGVRSPPP